MSQTAGAACGMFGRSLLRCSKGARFGEEQLCAGTRNGHPAEEPEVVDFDKWNQLQSRVANYPRINWGDRNNVTTDRTLRAKIGEGKLATLKGYVLRAIAVEMFPTNRTITQSRHSHLAGAKCRRRFVAEISPHHCPLEWTAANINALAVSKAPVRVTGQLFFDSSHQPCKNGERTGWRPKRSSLWEIHPTYDIKACISDCGREGQWEELKQNPQGT